MGEGVNRTVRRMRGFEPAASLVRGPVRSAGESRGFAVSRLLTHWAEVVGDDIAASCRPVRVTYGREGFGATLTLLVPGAAAPVVQMGLPAIRDRVNACYGYNAVSRILLTQTDTASFAEGQAAFAGRDPVAPANPVDAAEAARLSGGVGDPDLRAALEELARNVISRARRSDAGAPRPTGKVEP